MAIIPKRFLAWAFLLTAIAPAARANDNDGAGVFDNFHEVERGELYRSAQMGPVDLERKIEKYGIKTIINLKGAHPGQAWFEEEKAVAERNGLTMINIAFRAERIPTASELTTLLDAYAAAPRPILVHCQAGADRSGEAVAIYLYNQTGDRKLAQKALSVLYFHFPFLYPAVDYFIAHVYGGAEWAKTYDPCAANYKYFDKSALCGTVNLPTAELSNP